MPVREVQPHCAGEGVAHGGCRRARCPATVLYQTSVPHVVDMTIGVEHAIVLAIRDLSLAHRRDVAD